MQHHNFMQHHTCKINYLIFKSNNMESHVLNKSEKRLEPTSSQCGFCVEGEVSNVKDCHYAPVYRISDRTNIIIARTVEYNKIEVGIPRCSSCADIHSKGDLKANANILMYGIIIVVITFALFQVIVMPILAIAGFSIFAGSINKNIQNRYASDNDIYSLEEGTYANETVRELLDLYWSLEKPKA
jgi:hypothetical protein